MASWLPQQHGTGIGLASFFDANPKRGNVAAAKEFSMSDENAAEEAGPADEREGAIHEVDVELYAVLGQVTMLVSQLLKIGRGAIIELEQKTTDPIELLVNQKLVAYGEIVTVDDKLGVTITDVVIKPFG